MNIDEEIKNLLAEEYRQGKTQEEIRIKYHISRPYINRLLSGKRDAEGLTLKTLKKMFPEVVVLLHGDAPSINAPKNRGNVVGVNHGTVGADCLSAVTDKILSSPDLSDAEKIKFLKALKK